MTTETGQRDGNFVVAAAQDANIFPIDIFEEGHLGWSQNQRRSLVGLHPKATLVFLLFPPLGGGVSESLICFMWLSHLAQL
jgi:hypothetical protein